MSEKILKSGVTHYLTIECTVDASVNVGVVQDWIRTEVAKKAKSLMWFTQPPKSPEELMTIKFAKQPGENFQELVNRITTKTDQAQRDAYLAHLQKIEKDKEAQNASARKAFIPHHRTELTAAEKQQRELSAKIRKE